MDDEAPDERKAVFERVAREVIEPVRRYLVRRTDPETAADVLSETLTVLWRRVDDVPADALPWVIGVAKWQLCNAQRMQRRTDRLTARVATTPDSDRDVADHAEQVVQAAALQQALEQVTPADAELLHLWAWDDLSPTQIAAVLGITANAVSLRLLRARRNLAEIVRKQEPAFGHELEEGRASNE